MIGNAANRRVYFLSDPRDGLVRYVGATSLTLPQRLRNHVRHARHGDRDRKSTWVRTLLSDGIEPLITLLEESADPLRESHWIATMRSAGIVLLNATRGGDAVTGPLGLPPEKRPSRYKNVANPIPKEQRGQRISAAKMGHRVSQETREKISKKLTGRPTGRTKDRCPAGHDYTPQNTRINIRGAKECRACGRARYAAKKARRDRLPPA